ncbi:F-box associated interaction domain [Arabidopsis thaliana x Arabidopsis arenosa]|uniref:F-box associated interaction domain n=1 Tax=Arabidopsis thaliana x Arabidopsis arenosa TaxID=1240361 RepID=A0A8T2BYR9_9BRAS|nr:F-box associated interaction domain [Arabidopsis thaliana x Arabidopsis arenosa]
MRTRSKKIKTVNNNKNLQKSEKKNKFDQLPLDLEIEIFKRLPLKSVARFLTLSKLCATTIRSPSFITSFPSQPCTLIASAPIIRTCHNLPSSFKSKDQRLYFFSSSSSSSTSFLSRLTCPSSPYPNLIEYYYHYANGLISVGCGREQIVTNPSTGRSITLPSVRTRRMVVKSFFGYDLVSDQYKVLCMTERLHCLRQDLSSQHQVFTLGEKKPWKMIDSTSIPGHCPWSNGVCIDGVVYYVAKTGKGMSQLSLMRFDLRADTLNLFTSLPEEIRTSSLCSDTLLNFEGKVAIAIPTTSYIFDVWVMDQDGEKHEWLKNITFSIEPWKSLFGYLYVRGTTHTGEFILAPWQYSDEFYVFHYNPGKNSFTKIKIDVSADDEFKGRSKRAIVFSNYVESVRLLSERQFMI